MQIYLARNNQQAGPYSLDQLNAMLASGEVQLTDLMWHEGMENWQQVGQMTRQQLFYSPTSGKKPTSVNLTKSTESHQPSWIRKRQATEYHEFDISQAQKQLDLATIPSRILAQFINFGLFILAVMPIYIHIYNSPKLMQFVEMMKNNQLNNQQMIEILSSIPSHIIILSDLLVLGLLISQLLLLVRRGQSIGKMIMGIRILDINSNAIPTITNLILLRTILPMVIFSFKFLGQFFLALDVITMILDKKRQSLHDKIAKTYVVRADDTQTTPLELKTSK